MKPSEAILLIPAHMRKSLIRYILYGELWEDFLRAVLEDKLVRSYELADSLNQASMFGWAQFLYNVCPTGARGNGVQAWIDCGGLKGIEAPNVSVWEELL